MNLLFYDSELGFRNSFNDCSGGPNIADHLMHNKESDCVKIIALWSTFSTDERHLQLP